MGLWMAIVSLHRSGKIGAGNWWKGWEIDTFLHGFCLLCLPLRLRWVDGLFLWHLA